MATEFISAGGKMNISKDAYRFIPDIYDCAFKPELWGPTLENIANYLSGSYVSLHSMHKLDINAHDFRASPWSADWIAKLPDFVQDIPGADQLGKSPIDTPFSTMSIMSEADFHKTRFSREWVAPQGLRDGLNVKFAETGSQVEVLTFATPDTRELITAEEHDFFALLSPHLRRATMIWHALEQKEAQSLAYQAALDCLNYPVILTDENRRVYFANRAAQSMLDNGDELQEHFGKLTVVEIKYRSAFEVALRKAHRGDIEIGLHGIGIPLTDQKASPAICYALPLNQSDARNFTGGASVALFIANGKGDTPVEAAVLSTIFGLTPAEIRVANAISGANGLQNVAELLNVSENTVKTHLKRIFDKTGTNKQSDLSRLLSELSSPVKRNSA